MLKQLSSSKPLLAITAASVLLAAGPAGASGSYAEAVAPAVGQPLEASFSPTAVSLEASAEQLYAWGEQFEHGEGVSRDHTEAVRMYCSASLKSHSGASYALGWMYANGRGVEQDDDLAAAWFRLAAKAGEEHAPRMLSRLNVGNPQREAECVLPGGEAWWPMPQSVPNPDRRTIRRWVHHLAPNYGLKSDLVLAVIAAESNFNPKARSHKNAQGLMQLIPATAARFGVANTYDPVQNIRGGMAYLKWLLNHFEGDVALALAGYNAGERAVERYSGIPPYPETRAYVKRILRQLDRSS